MQKLYHSDLEKHDKPDIILGKRSGQNDRTSVQTTTRTSNVVYSVIRNGLDGIIAVGSKKIYTQMSTENTGMSATADVKYVIEARKYNIEYNGDDFMDPFLFSRQICPVPKPETDLSKSAPAVKQVHSSGLSETHNFMKMLIVILLCCNFLYFTFAFGAVVAAAVTSFFTIGIGIFQFTRQTLLFMKTIIGFLICLVSLYSVHAYGVYGAVTVTAVFGVGMAVWFPRRTLLFIKTLMGVLIFLVHAYSVHVYGVYGAVTVTAVFAVIISVWFPQQAVKVMKTLMGFVICIGFSYSVHAYGVYGAAAMTAILTAGMGVRFPRKTLLFVKVLMGLLLCLVFAYSVHAYGVYATATVTVAFAADIGVWFTQETRKVVKTIIAVLISSCFLYSIHVHMIYGAATMSVVLAVGTAVLFPRTMLFMKELMGLLPCLVYAYSVHTYRFTVATVTVVSSVASSVWFPFTRETRIIRKTVIAVLFSLGFLYSLYAHGVYVTATLTAVFVVGISGWFTLEIQIANREMVQSFQRIAMFLAGVPLANKNEIMIS